MVARENQGNQGGLTRGTQTSNRLSSKRGQGNAGQTPGNQNNQGNQGGQGDIERGHGEQGVGSSGTV